MSGAQSGSTAGGGGWAPEGIHKEAECRQLGNPRQQMVRQNSNVRPGAAKDGRQQQSVHSTMRVIRGNHQRATLRNRSHASGQTDWLNIERVERANLEWLVARRNPRVFVERAVCPQPQQPRKEGPRGGE